MHVWSQAFCILRFSSSGTQKSGRRGWKFIQIPSAPDVPRLWQRELWLKCNIWSVKAGVNTLLSVVWDLIRVRICLRRERLFVNCSPDENVGGLLRAFSSDHASVTEPNKRGFDWQETAGLQLQNGFVGVFNRIKVQLL